MKKAVAFSFGRMQPPTIGHEILVNGLQTLAKSGNADHFLFLSHTQNEKTDPLSWKIKCKVVSASFPDVNLYKKTNIITPFEALEKLSKEYEDIVFFVGSDRIDEFTERMTPYATKWGVKNFAVMSAGQRDPDAIGAIGTSASKLREYAKLGKKKEFTQALPKRLNSAMKAQVYLLMLKGLNPAKRRKVNARTRNIIIKRSKR